MQHLPGKPHSIDITSLLSSNYLLYLVRNLISFLHDTKSFKKMKANNFSRNLTCTINISCDWFSFLNRNGITLMAVRWYVSNILCTRLVEFCQSNIIMYAYPFLTYIFIRSFSPTFSCSTSLHPKSTHTALLMHITGLFPLVLTVRAKKSNVVRTLIHCSTNRLYLIAQFSHKLTSFWGFDNRLMAI